MVKVIETINANRAKIIAGSLAFLATAAALVVFGLLAVAFWLNTDAGNRWMVARTNAALRETGYVLVIDKFNLSGLLSLNAQSLQISLDGKKIITGENISLDVNLASIAFKHPEIHLKAQSFTIHDSTQSKSDRQNKRDGSFRLKRSYLKTAQLNVEIEAFGLSKAIVDGGLTTRVDLKQQLAFYNDRIGISGHVELDNTKAGYAAYLPQKIEAAVLFYPASGALNLENCIVTQNNYTVALQGNYAPGDRLFTASVSGAFIHPKARTNQTLAPIVLEAEIEGAADNFSSTTTLTTLYQKHPLGTTLEINREKNILSVRIIKASGEFIDLEGKLIYDLSTALAEGYLTAACSDLTFFNQFADSLDIAGSATTELILSSKNGAQNIALESMLADICQKDYRAKVVHVKVDADNINKSKNLKADIDISITEAHMSSVEVKNATTTITVKDSSYSAVLSGHNRNFKPFSFAAEGRLESFDPQNILADIKLQSNLLTIDELFLNEGYQLEGSLNVEGKISGTLSMPEFIATARIENGLYVDKYNNIRLTDITAEASVDDKDIQLLSLTAKDRDEKGVLILSGGVSFADKNNPRIEADLHLEDMHLLNHQNLDGWLNADIALQTDATGYLISGTLSSPEFSIRIPDRFGPDIPQLNIIEPDTRKSSTADLFTRTKLDLTFKAENKVFIYGLGLDAELKGLLNVQGTLNEPLVEGNLETIRGRYEEFGRRFNLDRVKLNFRGPIPPSPYLDIEVSTQIDDITGRILISDSIEDPKITFASIPSLPEDEVLSIILFGKNIRKISPLQAIQLANTARRFSGDGGSGFDPLYDLRTLTGLDDIYVKDVGEGSATVGVGKYISDDVYIKVEQGTETGSSEASIEVQLMPSISLQSKAAQNGESNIGVFWEWEY